MIERNELTSECSCYNVEPMSCKVTKNHHGNLAFRLNWKGVRSWEGTGLKATPENLDLMNARATLINYEIKAGSFEYLQWFPDGNRASLYKQQAEKKKPPETIGQWYKKWIARMVPPLAKKSRKRKYESHFKVHILPRHKDTYLHLFGVGEIRDLLVEITQKVRPDTGERITVKTAKNILNATLRALFRDAVAEKLIERNPFEDIPRNKKWWPKTIRPAPDPFTEEDRDATLKWFYKKWWAIWPRGFVFLYILFWHGMRPSELTGRRWRDYDPKTGVLSIETSLTEGEEGELKTDASFRTVKLNKPAQEMLAHIMPLHVKPDDLILTDRKGKAINQWKFGENQFQTALRACKIRHRSFYHTRHTFITACLMRGEHPSAIADYVGTSPEMIFSRYSKWIRGYNDFGQAALEASTFKFLVTPMVTPERGKPEKKQYQRVRMVRGGGFEPPRHFWH
jgi:integrase